MKIIHKIIDGTLYVGLCGELDESTSAETRATLDALIDDFVGNKVVIDMSTLRFMDSTGVGVLLGRYKRVKQHSASIFISSPTSTVDKVLKISGIYDIMPKIV